MCTDNSYEGKTNECLKETDTKIVKNRLASLLKKSLFLSPSLLMINYKNVPIHHLFLHPHPFPHDCAAPSFRRYRLWPQE